MVRLEKKQKSRLDMEARLELMRKFGPPEGGKHELPKPPSRQELIQRLRLQETELPRFWKPLGQPTKPLFVGQSLAYNERLRTAEGEWHVEESVFQQASPDEQYAILMMAYIVFEAGECVRNACNACGTANQCLGVNQMVSRRCARCNLRDRKCDAVFGPLW
jgi:hypothetical protein